MISFGLLVVCVLVGGVCAFREGIRWFGIGLLLVVVLVCGWVMLAHLHLR